MWQVLTVGLTMCFGIMGLPHILMRFFTVKDAAAARGSVTIATLIMSVFYILILIIGFGAVATIWGNPDYLGEDGQLLGGSNLVALHTAKSLGGDLLFGYMSAVTFATILAVVAGLTLAGSATIAHDLRHLFSKTLARAPSNELLLSRLAALGIGGVAFLLALAFEFQNIAIVTALALAIAASVNFPILLLALYWGGLTSRGCVWGGGFTLALVVLLIIFSDGVWVEILGHADGLFPLIYPTVVIMPACFFLVIVLSKLDHSQRAIDERQQFPDQLIRSEVGIDISAANHH